MNVCEYWFQRIKNVFCSEMFFRFLGIGIINGIDGVIFSTVFSMFLSVNLAFVIGYCISISISYFLNSFFVFKRRFTVERYVKFCLSYIPNFIIQNVCVFVLFNCLDIHQVVAFVLAPMLGVPITYVILNLRTFRN